MAISRRGAVVLIALALLITLGNVASAQTAEGSLYGVIEDQVGAVIVGATVTATDAAGATKTAVSNSSGAYQFANLAPGTYKINAIAGSFQPTESTDVEVVAGRKSQLNLKLFAVLEKQEVTVLSEGNLSTDLNRNRTALVLRGKDLDALPDDTEDLTTVLRAMAGPSAGLSGSQFLVDGYDAGTLPPKESIKEIRLNENPFSSEYDKLGFGRIEIITKAGTDKLRGGVFFNFNDESLNARNPFAANRAPFQSKYFGGSVSGPIVKGKSSYFFDFERRNVTDNSVVNAVVLNDALNIEQFNRAVITPQTRTSISPRFDYQLNEKNSLVARYSFFRTTNENAGVGEFTLPSRGYNSTLAQHSFYVTESAVLNARTINETRFRFESNLRQQQGVSTVPGIRVLDAFIGGGSDIGLASYDEKHWELQNNTTYALAKHILRGGVRLRGVHIGDTSPQNFNGTYTFSGGTGPMLNANNQVVTDPATGLPVEVQLTSIESYRRTLFFQRLGRTPAEIRALGGGAAQFGIATGNPFAGIRQFDFGVYVQDDWQVRPDLTVGLGLRYEGQSNIKSPVNFAPRLSFAWAPGAKADSSPKTVFRGGFGLFYDRFSESLSLQALRFNGVNQQLYVVSDPAALDFFPNVPPSSLLPNSAQITRRVADDLQAPYSIQTGISVERELPLSTTLAVSFVNTRTLHVLRSRNINAPLPGTFLPDNPDTGTRPLGNIGNVFQYESSGVFNQYQLVFNAYTNVSSRLSLFGSYILNNARSDTDGADSFPADSFNLSNEYGRAFLDSRHRFIGGGSIDTMWGIRLSPLIIASSGRPFNITTGSDTNGDLMFTERPAFASNLNKPGVIVTRFGAFDPNPDPGQQLIPRNLGQGPVFFLTILRASKTFTLGSAPAAQAASSDDAGPASESRYKLNFALQIMNLFNHTNSGTVIGDLSSPLFGQSNALARGSFSDGSAAGAFNSRRIEAQVKFSF
ncbi:MAG: TonB-dependent receptor [Pyrinomonadaceae bacterium]